MTAQRRSENLQTVPVSVTAFSAESLRTQRIDSIRGLTERTPGLTMGQFNPGQPQLYIRGVGTNVRGAGEDPGVIVFVDEVYVGRAQGSDMDLFDLDRVEVLRGPQGTLFGRNVIGGAISLMTTKPGPDVRWSMEGSAGEDRYLSGRAYVSGPLADGVYGKVAFSSKRRDSQWKNNLNRFASSVPGTSPFGDHHLDGTSSESVRGQLRWQPRESLDLNLTAYASRQDAPGAVRHYIPGTAGGSLYNSDSTLIPGYASDYRNVLVDDAGSYGADASGATLRLDVGLGSVLTFTSLSAYRYATALNVEPGLGTPRVSALRLAGTSAALVPFTVDGNNDYVDRDKMLTQEFRLASAAGGPLRWVAGVFYLNQDVFRNETGTTAIKTRAAGGGVAGTNTLGGEAQFSDNVSYAAFGQATYAFTNRLSATLGARYTRDQKTFHGIGTAGGLTINENYDVRASRSWSKTTPKASLEFAPTESSLTYASIARGYKAGGFPNLGVTAAVARTPYEPETATQYEVGAKTEWFDSRLRVNASVYRIDYNDLQVLLQLIPVGSPAGTPGAIYTLNAADSTIDGAELEFSAAPTERVLISGSMTWLDARFDDFFVPPGFLSPGGAPVNSNAGKYLRNSPRWAANIFARYTHPLANGAGLSFQLDTRYKDKVYQDPANLEFAAVPAYAVSDVRVAWANAAGSIEIAGSVSNVFDRQYLLHNYPVLGSGFATVGYARAGLLTVTVRN